jgi:hypothetical protein
MADLIMAAADGVLMDSIGHDEVRRARELAGLGAPAAGEPWVPSGPEFRSMAQRLPSSVVDHVREVRALADKMRRSRPEDWSIFGVRCDPDSAVLYKLYARFRGGEWLHVELDVGGMGRHRPYLLDPRDTPQFTPQRWRQLRSRCVDGDLTLLAPFTVDAPDKPGLHAFVRLAKVRLMQLGVGPIEPVRFARGWGP